MSDQTPVKEPTQVATAGKNSIQVGRDYTSTMNFNFTIFLIGILAMGGIAWGLYVGVVEKPSVNQTQPPASPVKPRTQK
jgi:hypothetical protein